MVGKDREPTTVSDTVNKIAEAPAFDNQFPAGRLTIVTALDVDGNSIPQKFLAQFLNKNERYEQIDCII